MWFIYLFFFFVGIPSQKSWGRKKAAFYDADIVEEYAGRSIHLFFLIGQILCLSQLFYNAKAWCSGQIDLK